MSKNLKDSLKYSYHNLKTLTNRNSGIIVYPDTTTLAINWENMDGIPRSMGGSYLSCDDEGELRIIGVRKINKNEIMKYLLASNPNIKSGGILWEIVTDLDEVIKIITIDGLD